VVNGTVKILVIRCNVSGQHDATDFRAKKWRNLFWGYIFCLYGQRSDYLRWYHASDSADANMPMMRLSLVSQYGVAGGTQNFNKALQRWKFNFLRESCLKKCCNCLIILRFFIGLLHCQQFLQRIECIDFGGFTDA